MSEEWLDIVCMGEAMIEFVHSEPQHGRPAYLQGFGGDTSNCAIAAARQGARVGYVSALGADRFGDLYCDLWRSEGIDISGVQRDPAAPTAVYFIEPAGDGRDFTYFRKGSAASRMTPASVPRTVIERAGLFMTSAISQAISASACDAVCQAITAARARGRRIAYDTNLRLNLWPLERARAVIHETARLADILSPSLDEARLLTGLESPQEILRYYAALGPAVIALKCGSDGAYIAAGNQCWHIPAIRAEVIDSSGAGDTFFGCLLARLAAGDDPVTAARYAVVAAGLSTEGLGAMAPIPRAAAVFAAKPWPRPERSDASAGQGRN